MFRKETLSSIGPDELPHASTPTDELVASRLMDSSTLGSEQDTGSSSEEEEEELTMTLQMRPEATSPGEAAADGAIPVSGDGDERTLKKHVAVLAPIVVRRTQNTTVAATAVYAEGVDEYESSDGSSTTSEVGSDAEAPEGGTEAASTQRTAPNWRSFFSSSNATSSATNATRAAAHMAAAVTAAASEMLPAPSRRRSFLLPQVYAAGGSRTHDRTLDASPRPEGPSLRPLVQDTPRALGSSFVRSSSFFGG